MCLSHEEGKQRKRRKKEGRKRKKEEEEEDRKEELTISEIDDDPLAPNDVISSYLWDEILESRAEEVLYPIGG